MQDEEILVPSAGGKHVDRWERQIHEKPKGERGEQAARDLETTKRGEVLEKEEGRRG